jgi:hypothetical protein
MRRAASALRKLVRESERVVGLGEAAAAPPARSFQPLHTLIDRRMCTVDGCTGHSAPEASLQGILSSNRRWAEAQVEKDPVFFSKLVDTQTPEWLW